MRSAPIPRSRPGRGALGLAAALVVLAAVVGIARAGQQQDPFPHADHEGLFPLCTGCHLGAESGETGRLYPEPSLCAQCHDGTEHDGEVLERVEWEGPTREPSNLVYAHAVHDSAVAEEEAETAGDAPRDGLECSECHNAPDAPRMEVQRAVTGRCLDCHAHRAENHYADAECATCHRPLAETGFARGRIASLPTPDSHDDPEFLARTHGELSEERLASCTTCHTRERCTSCHVDTGATAVIARVPAAPETMELPATEARYPTPASHGAEDFLSTHGRDLEVAECSTCHTQESCTTCHSADTPDPVTRLASRDRAMAPGVEVQRSAPPSHASPWFIEDHEALAAAGQASCRSCHTQSYCTECHESPDRPGYHPPNFALKHSTQAYGREMECANCHSSSAFCRECHRQLGMQARGRLDGSFHDKAPAWLLRHAQAARQDLESCTTCHRQSDCLQCHSQLGRFRVSPHGPGFEAERLFDKNPQICFACHLSNPLEGGSP